MTSPAGSDDRPLILDTLEDLRARLAGAISSNESSPALARALLQPLLIETVSAPDTRLGAATRRLAVMAEVWDCLVAEETADDQIKPFFGAVLDDLISGVRAGSEVEAVARLLQESEARWGEYLSLLDPTLDPTPPAPEWEASFENTTTDDEPAFDAARLLRELAGLGGPEEAVEAPPAHRPVPRVEREPAPLAARVADETAADEAIHEDHPPKQPITPSFESEGSKTLARLIRRCKRPSSATLRTSSASSKIWCWG